MSEVNQLLGLDDSTGRPNAYQVFGLELLESDDAKIQNAIREVIGRLKAAKGNGDVAVWNAAVKTVNKAQAVLSDAEKKAEYDRRIKSKLQRVPESAVAVGADASVDDTIGAWLPPDDPFATFDMATALEQMSEEIEDAEDEDLEQAPVLADVLGQVASEPPVPIIAMDIGNPQSVGIADPIVKAANPKVGRRKKRFSSASLVMTLFVVGLFGGLGYCVKLLMDRENARPQVAQTNPKAAPAPIAQEPTKPDVDADPVMGVLLPETPTGPPKEDTGIRMGVNTGDNMNVSEDNDVDNDMSTALPMNPGTPATDMTATTTNPDSDAPNPNEPTAEMVEAASQAATAARSAIRNHESASMMPLSEKALELATTDEQREQALARRRLVHYANEYQSAIDRAIDGLEATERIEIREGFIVAVVEVTTDILVLRVQGKNKTYERENLVPILAHAFASRKLPDDEAVVTALRGAWQCLQKDADDSQRQEAFESWSSITGQSDDANVDGFQQEVEAIFK